MSAVAFRRVLIVVIVPGSGLGHEHLELMHADFLDSRPR